MNTAVAEPRPHPMEKNRPPGSSPATFEVRIRDDHGALTRRPSDVLQSEYSTEQPPRRQVGLVTIETVHAAPVSVFGRSGLMTTKPSSTSQLERARETLARSWLGTSAP